MRDSFFTPGDLAQMAEIGFAPEDAAHQLHLFRQPPAPTRVLRPCRVGDGIRVIGEEEHPELLRRFETARRGGQLGKFVPASGVASRMFKDLLVQLAAPSDAPLSAPLRRFFSGLTRFAFFDELAGALAEEGVDLAGDLGKAEQRTVLRVLLAAGGLGYAELPKGLLLFHRYREGPRTPLEEHLIEAVHLVKDGDGRCRVHFTVSTEHQEAVESLLRRVVPALEARHQCRFEISISNQRPSTHTLAVDPDNHPFRLADGSLLFRPGGHGALLSNLQSLGLQGWDIVLLKNIDNVVTDELKGELLLWKRLLGGHLLALREEVFACLERLEASDAAAPARSGEAEERFRWAEKLLARRLSRALPRDFAGRGWEERRRILIDSLDRPLRVCGVVRNEGEPGGGPFWVESADGEVSLQIVEASQIDAGDAGQEEILRQSTHFNPVDIACGLLDRWGEPYDLSRFVDPAAVFITGKTHEGRALKALERPGLWNGAMAGWNTVFVEVPVSTFAPVKTVLDLLRPEHQPAS